MKGSWRFFFVVEALLLLFGFWQIINNEELLLLLIFSVFCLWFASRRKPNSRFRTYLQVIGYLTLFLTLVFNPAIWAIVVFAVLFFGLKGIEFSGLGGNKQSFWKQKQMIFVETKQVEPHNGTRIKQKLIGSQRIGTDIYEWDDINIVTIVGDTIIDLGNTLLPKDDNIIIIRKVVGRTRILVPLGAAISIEHTGLIGNIIFEEETYPVKTECLKVYSNDYDENPRRLKIITDTLFGDVEVIRV